MMTGPATTPPRFKSWSDYWLAAEAMAYLGVARLAVSLLPFVVIARWMDSTALGSGPAIPVSRLILAVERAASRVPWRCVCIHQAIAAQRMLRRRGHDSQFVYGILSSPGDLSAHAWVRIGNRILLGAEAASGVAEVAAFPPQKSNADRMDIDVGAANVGSKGAIN